MRRLMLTFALASLLGLAAGGLRAPARAENAGPGERSTAPSAAKATAPADPLPFDASDRAELVALAATLPLHGVVPPTAPDLTTGADALWAKFARRVLDVFAPPSLAAADRNRLVMTARPLTSAIRAYVPRHRRYLALQAKLAELAPRFGATPAEIPSTKRKLRVGATGDAVATLRARLLLEGYGDPGLTDDRARHFDERLKRALQAWEKDHDLPRTTVVDPPTRRALNAPLASPIGDIALALQRWRDLDLRSDDGPAVIVHINAQELSAERGGVQQLAMRVVVGKASEENQTPAKSAPMEAVIVHPEWIVPQRIVEELRPGVNDVPELLMDKGYDVDVDSEGKWRVRMPPGPDNPLGSVKFTLVGTGGVYLHDTSGRAAFKKKARALSHGCVRVANPEGLASWVLRGRELELEQAMALRSITQRFRLPEPIMVHLVYQTLAVAPDGRLLRFADPYGRDGQVRNPVDPAALAKAMRQVTPAMVTQVMHPVTVPDNAVAPPGVTGAAPATGTPATGTPATGTPAPTPPASDDTTSDEDGAEP